MLLAGEHLADDDSLKAALDGLDLGETLDFQTDVRQDAGDLLGRKVRFDIAFEPVIRNIHIVVVLNLLKSNKDRDFSAKSRKM